MTENQEYLYRALKQLEVAAQNLLFAIPQAGSEAHKALSIPPGQEWKLGQAIDSCLWIGEMAKRAATSVYMQGKE